jgi:hypothetical protein
MMYIKVLLIFNLSCVQSPEVHVLVLVEKLVNATKVVLHMKGHLGCT